MSKVYLATDKKLGRRVAVKMLSLSSPQNQQDALHEARLLARFNHPHIVQIYDVLESDGQVCLEMEYVQGATLQHYTKTHILSIEQKIELLSHIADGLAAAHQQNILHLDLKPGNILVNDQGVAKIADFGISQLEDTSSSAANCSYGSLTAMSPEQLRSEPLDTRSDLFSFGLIAYQLLAGTHPYSGQAEDQSDKSIAEQIKYQPLQASAKRILGIPATLAQLIDLLLQFDKSTRPATAVEVSQQLKQILQSVSYENSEATVSLEEMELLNKAHEKAKARKKWLSVSALVAVAFCIITVGYWYWLENKPKIYIAALPIELREPNTLTAAQKEVLSLAVNDAIKQVFYEKNNYVLISDSEVRQTKLLLGENFSVKEIATALNADELVSASLSCNLTTCDLHFESIDGKSAALLGNARSASSNENYSEIFNASISSLTAIFSKGQRRVSLLDDSKRFLQEYAVIYERSESGVDSPEELVDQIEKLIAVHADFIPLYTLYRKAATRHFSQYKDPRVLLRLKSTLLNAPESYKTSSAYLIDLLQVYGLLDDRKNAKLLLNKIEASNLDTYEKLALAGTYYKNIGLKDKSLEYTKQAYDLRPTLANTRNLAIGLTLQGKYSEAIPFLEQALKLAPNNFVVNKTLADVYLLEGLIDQAIKLYKILISNQSKSVTTLSNLSIALSLQGELAEALRYAEKASALSQENDKLLLNYADLLYLNGKTNAAKETYEKIVSNNRENTPSLHFSQALVHINEGQRALSIIEQLIRQEPSNAEAYFVKTLILTRLGENMSAISALEQSLERGWKPDFYRLPWFVPLCKEPKLSALLGKHNFNFICNNEVTLP